MQTMVEKLARVLMRCHIQDDDPEGRTWYAWSDDARAVLTALRDPTEGMCDAAWQATRKGPSLEQRMADALASPRQSHMAKAKVRWQAMIDQALTEGE